MYTDDNDGHLVPNAIFATEKFMVAGLSELLTVCSG